MIPLDPDKVRCNEKLDHLQARALHLQPGHRVLIGRCCCSSAPLVIASPTPSLGGVRWFLWRDGRILRRQYEARQVRGAEKEAKRRQR